MPDSINRKPWTFSNVSNAWIRDADGETVCWIDDHLNVNERTADEVRALAQHIVAAANSYPPPAWPVCRCGSTMTCIHEQYVGPLLSAAYQCERCGLILTAIAEEEPPDA